jgi:hypothetical protein
MDDLWMPIETAPRNGSAVLLCRNIDADGKAMPSDSFGLFCQVAAWWSGEGEGGAWVVYCSTPKEPTLHFEPTHWQALRRPAHSRPLQGTRIDRFILDDIEPTPRQPS